MKFWKIGLFTVLVFFAASFIVVYSSCEKNICDNVTCFNGGSCNSGACHCPVGYEDPQCQTLSRARFIGVYSGYTQCIDNGVFNSAYQLDSVTITANAGSNILYVSVFDKLLNRTLSGYVNNNEATYSIIVLNDSMQNYLQTYTITLQGDKALTFNTYTHDSRIIGDTLNSSCYFKGSKQ